MPPPLLVLVGVPGTEHHFLFDRPCVGQSTKPARDVRAYADEVKANEATMWGNLQRLQANAPQGHVAAALNASALHPGWVATGHGSSCQPWSRSQCCQAQLAARFITH